MRLLSFVLITLICSSGTAATYNGTVQCAVDGPVYSAIITVPANIENDWVLSESGDQCQAISSYPVEVSFNGIEYISDLLTVSYRKAKGCDYIKNNLHYFTRYDENGLVSQSGYVATLDLVGDSSTGEIKLRSVGTKSVVTCGVSY